MFYEEEFYITVLSDASSQVFPDNTLSSFTTKLPDNVDIRRGNWKVGVTEIYINDFIRGPEPFTPYSFTLYIDYNADTGSMEGVTNLPYKYGVVQSFEKDFLPSLVQNILPYGRQTKSYVEHRLVNEIQGFLRSTENYETISYEEFVKDDTYPFVTVANADDSIVFSIFVNKEYTVKGMLKDIFKQIKNIKNQKQKIMNAFSPLLTMINTPPNLDVFLYTDIVKPGYFGDIKSRCLRVVSIPNGKVPTPLEFKNIYYFSLEKKLFDTISIKICDKFGENIAFRYSRTPTKIILHFKNDYFGQVYK